jgi:hypothetical protein
MKLGTLNHVSAQKQTSKKTDLIPIEIGATSPSANFSSLDAPRKKMLQLFWRTWLL